MRPNRDRPPLNERLLGGRAADPEPDADGTPCWVQLTDRRVPGTVHGWQRLPDGSWSALVVAWLPSDDVAPR
jgi:hypothetical protein